MEKITEYIIRSTVSDSQVKAWTETIMLPTYEIGAEEKNPIFLEKRVYQGSCGSVYPYPVVEEICDEKKDKAYKAIFIENEYIKVMILPELGGRIHMAYDKVKKRHFVYYNQVVKPALVGLTGPWISGGIEFNWPQHHRPSTFLPVDCMIEEFSDGSKTVWCSEVERMTRTKGMAGFTLYPGKSYIEIKAKVYNRTSFPQTFLWWANPAVVVHKDYHSVFPPDVNAVFDHGKRDVVSFPIATSTYYKCDYSSGVDISRYDNIPVPTSYMAVNSKYDFVGGYEENIKAGLLHVADHHINVGKKQWTWGHGDFGQAWDRNLTDEDGPYIELMTGMYCDNQPDFSWLQPYEEKSWTQYFMPYVEVGRVKNATKDAIIGIEYAENQKTATVKLYTSSAFQGLRVMVCCGNRVYLDQHVNASPAVPFVKEINIPDFEKEKLIYRVYNAEGRILVEFKEIEETIRPIPDPAKAAKDPKEIASLEQLFLTGQHLEQYRHATYDPKDYYLEALSRESGDIRCNNAMGLLLMRKGQFAKAQCYFEAAIATQLERNPNPYDGEPHYNLGWSKRMQGDVDGAFDAFYKSAWNAAWQDGAYYNLALIDTLRGNLETAIDFIDRSLVKNWHNHKGRQLKCSILRLQDRYDEALELAEESLAIDPFNMGVRFEMVLTYREKNEAVKSTDTLDEMNQLMQGAVHSYIEYSLDFANAGLYAEADEFLNYVANDANSTYPIIYYALGYYAACASDMAKATDYMQKAHLCAPDYCFPNKIDEVLMLQKAIELNPNDDRAYYYLGNFWYAARQYTDALECWERSACLNNTFPTVWRNLSLAYYNKENDKQKARNAIERAFSLDDKDPRILMELDQLYKKLRVPHLERLDFLEKYASLVEQRDDLCIERITLYNQLGEYQKAKSLITNRQFHPWEGGEGKVTGQFVICCMELAKQEIAKGNYRNAVDLLKQTEHYPFNLGEGKLSNAEENDIHYYMGCAYEGLQEIEKAKYYFSMATMGSSEPTIAFFYNDQQPDKIFYQGMAWLKLGNEKKAHSCFNHLIKHGEKHLFDHVKVDYFAVSLPELLIWDDDLNQRNQIHCHLVMALGHLGLGHKEKAKTFIDKVLSCDMNHQVAMGIARMLV